MSATAISSLAAPRLSGGSQTYSVYTLESVGTTTRAPNLGLPIDTEARYRFSDAGGLQPAQTRTGRRGYFGYWGSLFESVHNTNVDPRSEVIGVAYWQDEQRPAELGDDICL
jgi:hypothetical protein